MSEENSFISVNLKVCSSVSWLASEEQQSSDLVLNAVRLQDFVHIFLVLNRWQLVKHDDILGTDCVFGCGPKAHKVRSEASPSRL